LGLAALVNLTHLEFIGFIEFVEFIGFVGFVELEKKSQTQRHDFSSMLAWIGVKK